MAGRKTKYDPEVTPALAEEYASEICTDVQIMAKLGICKHTFYAWQNKYPKFAEALKRGKAVANAGLVKAMEQSAVGYEVEESETTVRLDKDKHPIGYNKTTRKRYIPPNTTMQIFLAKNRMPEDFKDVNHHEVDVKGEMKVSTLAELMMEEAGYVAGNKAEPEGEGGESEASEIESDGD